MRYEVVLTIIKGYTVRVDAETEEDALVKAIINFENSNEDGMVYDDDFEITKLEE